MFLKHACKKKASPRVQDVIPKQFALLKGTKREVYVSFLKIFIEIVVGTSEGNKAIP